MSVPALAYTPGTYAGVGQGGMGGPVHVSVSFDETSITAVEIGENNETPGISDPAKTRIPQDIVTYQSLAVDVVTGASLTSNAILNAVADAVQQAGGNVEALRNVAIEKNAPAPDETLSVDVLVIGGGVSGLSAANSAAEAGLNTLLIEKLEALGGSSARSAGAITAGTVEDSDFTSEMFSDWLIEKRPDDFKNESLIRAITRMSYENIEYLRSIGYGLEYVLPNPNDGGMISTLYNPNESFVLGSGALLIKAYEHAVAKHETLSIRLNTAGTELLQDADGAVTGAVAECKDGSKLTIHAKAVILATGGWCGAGDDEEMRSLVGCPNAKGMVNYGGTGNTGDGILLAKHAGAKLIDSLPVPVEGMGVGTPVELPNNAPMLIVNKNGNRFINEAAPLSDLLSAVALESSGACFYILDQACVDAGNMAATIEAGAYQKADTVNTLAAALGADPAALAATIERYNALQGKADEDFGKSAESMLGIGEGPYYAIPAVPHTMLAYGTVVINENCQILCEDGGIIANLYAVGELAGANIAGYRPIGSGMSLQYDMCTGRIASEHIISQIQ